MKQAPVEVATAGELEIQEKVTAQVESIRVLMVAGGTGGHIFPALAVAEELRGRSRSRGGGNPEYEILFLGTGRGLEDQVIPAAGFALRKVAGAGLKGIGGFKRLRNFLVLPRSAIETAWLLREYEPRVMVGLGGYLAGPAMLIAALRDVPTLLIEPNAVPGFTNRVLAPVVRVAAVGFEETAAFYGAKARQTGLPVRRAFASVPAKPHTPPFTVLILGGSQGSKAINDCVMASLERFSRQPGCPRFIHQPGERDYNAVRQAYQERGLPAEVHAFIDDVPDALARADLVISRAGANAVAELAAAGKAAVLVPFPHAADQHQLANARSLARAGAARLIEQKDLTPEKLVSEVTALLATPAQLEQMELAAHARARPGAAAEIADLVESLAGRLERGSVNAG